MLDDLKEKWPEILDFFKQEYDIADVSFKTWILPLEVKTKGNWNCFWTSWHKACSI